MIAVGDETGGKDVSGIISTWFYFYCSLFEDLCTQIVITKKNSKVNKPQMRMLWKIPRGTFQQIQTNKYLGSEKKQIQTCVWSLLFLSICFYFVYPVTFFFFVEGLGGGGSFLLIIFILWTQGGANSPGGALPYLAYAGMCRWTGYGF